MREHFVLNQIFAKKYRIKANLNYSVSPKHSGIYPVNPSLFKIWNEMGIKATR